MIKDTELEMAERWAKGYKKHQAHMMGPVQVCILVFAARRRLIERCVFFFSFLRSLVNLFPTAFSLFFANTQNTYYDDLSRTASIENLKPVMTRLHNDSSERFLDDLTNFRRDVYRIIDDDTFIKIKG